MESSGGGRVSSAECDDGEANDDSDNGALDHPLFGRVIGLDSWCSLPHVVDGALVVVVAEDPLVCGCR